MRKTSTGRLIAALLATVLCAVAALVAAAAPANAAASGYLLMKGTGSVYTANPIVNQGGIPGGDPKSFAFKIVNNGSTRQQFKVTVSNYIPGSMTSSLLLGSTALPTPYYTAPLAPGASLVLTLKVSVVAGAPQGEYSAALTLNDPETGTQLDIATADVNATYQTGNTGHDLFLKTGTQPFVGGSYGPQFETATTLKVGTTALFTLRLQNNSGSPGAITLQSFGNSCGAAFSAVVKVGTTNVTAAVAAGTYSTGVLAPGAKKELKVSIKLVSATTCTADYFLYQSTGPGGSSFEYAHVVTAA
jgi:hypothetical protein